MVRHEWMRQALLAYIRRSGWEQLVPLPQAAQPGEAVVLATPLESAVERVAVQS